MPIDYASLLAAGGADGRLADAWLAAYAGATPWRPHVLEVEVGRLTYLFDAAPSLDGADGDDRVVGVFGRSCRPAGRRDAARMAGFVPQPRRWSGRALDRGHFVSHAAGGGTDLNLFPQASGLNRGRTPDGRRWRALERRIAVHAGTFLFVRPSYADATWVPDELEAGFVRAGDVVVERFANRSAD